ncbi:MAG: hypothetical protein RL147_1040 [Actinomycetota bacterium]|jgi:uncharacterized repeat protein (TIGR03843 family)
MNKYQAIETKDLIVTGRLIDASNATLYAHVLHEESELSCIYKPIAGERPLWDFDQGCLANREYAAYCVSEFLGLNLVPFTVLRDGPFGLGMVQEWIEINESVDLSEYFFQDRLELRRMALFDAIINNTDRKIGHILPTLNNGTYGCDHGVTFHEEDKLRTVLWQWAGDLFLEDEIALLRQCREGLEGALGKTLEPLLTQSEIKACLLRVDRMLRNGVFPEPSPNWPAVPWPAF